MVRTDTLGETYTLTGQLAHQSVNQNLLAVGSAYQATAPALSPPSPLLTATPSADVTPVLSLAYTATPLGAGEKLLIFATRPVSAGKNFLPNGDYKLIAVTAAAAASPQNILAAWQAVFGSFALDQKIFFKLKVVNTTNGQSSSTLQVSCIVQDA